MSSALADTDFAQQWDQWHEAHERARADEHGFLAITSLNWLSDEPQRFPDAPGKWWTGPDGVSVDLGTETLVLDGAELTGRHDFGVIAERASLFPRWNDAVIEVAKRGGYDVIRPRHPHSDVLRAYRGTAAYPPSPAWVATGHYTEFDTPRPTTVGAVVDDLKHVYDAPGEIAFRLGDAEYTLTAFPGSSGGLMVLFTDETSGKTTYAANRVVALPAPGPDGTVELDFNRAVNLPCAYTEHATCPLPPAENRLPAAVEAGELKPY